MPVVKMPDGTQVQFPDDMPSEQIRDMIARKFPNAGAAAATAKQAAVGAQGQAGPAAAPEAWNPIGDANAAFQAGANQGITLGFGDELYAGVTAPFRAIPGLFNGGGYDLGGAYGAGLDMIRGSIAADQGRNPIAATAGDVIGSLVTGGALMKGGVTLMAGAKPTIRSVATRGAAEGAAYGGVSGFGRSDGDLEDRLWDAGKGALFGGALGGGVGTVAGALAGRAAQKAVPSVKELKAQAGALYDQAAARGTSFGRAEVKQVADDIAAKAITNGIDPTLHPRATAALKRLQDAAGSGMTIENAQTMRRILAGAAKDPMNPDEARIASAMIEQFDNMVAAKSPELAQARGIYHQAKKGELIEQTIELARVRAGQYGNGGMENALRTEFRALQRQIVKGQLKGLSKQEIDAINRVAEGGKIENLARWIGKAAPTGIVSAGLGSGVPFLIGSHFGGPQVGAAAAGATMAAGLLGRGAAAAMTGRNAVQAALAARAGGTVLPPALSAGQQGVAQALIAAGGNEAGKLPQLLRTAPAASPPQHR